jgi:copper oxidase (laccase) domain-containing protein
MVMTQTADCLALFFYYTNKDNQRCILVHCGRPAGTPIDGRSIIHDALARVVPDGDVEHLEVLACGSICGRHLPHQDGQGRAQAEQYLHAYGEGVFCNAGKLELDMYEVLLHVLEGEGVVQEQITYFGPRCTYNARDMASHRQCIINGERRSTANTVMVTTH